MLNLSVPSGKIDKESMADIKAAFKYLDPLIVCGAAFQRLEKVQPKGESETKDVKSSQTPEKSTDEKIISIMTSTRDFFFQLCFYKEDIFDKMMFNIWHLYKVFGVDLIGDKAWKGVESDKSRVIKKEPKESDETSSENLLSKQSTCQRKPLGETEVEYFYFDENAGDYDITKIGRDEINKELKKIIKDGNKKDGFWSRKTDTNDENAIEKICYCLGYYLHRLAESLNIEWKTKTESFVTYEGKILEFIKVQTPTNADNEKTAAAIRDKLILYVPLFQCAELLERNRTWEKSDKKEIGLIIISTRNVLWQRFIDDEMFYRDVHDEIFDKMMLNIRHLYKVFGVDLLELQEGKEEQKKIFYKILERNTALNKDKYFYFEPNQDFFKNVKCEEVAVDVINGELEQIIKDVELKKIKKKAESLLEKNEPLNEIQKKCWYFDYHLHYLVKTRYPFWKRNTEMFAVKDDKFLQQIREDMASKIK